MIASPSTAQLARFYESKTASILSRYGPGPRVHYHTGIFDEPFAEAGRAPVLAPATALRSTLVAAQERLLALAAEVWDVRSIAFKEVLDVGCGLGGGAIFWAQRFAASVTAVTTAAAHLFWVARFAAQAGVGPSVQPRLCNASEVPGESCFDAAVAIESCSSFPREPWFERAGALLRGGGRVLIADLFLGQPEYRHAVDSHWLTQIGTIEDYLIAARHAGFCEDAVYDYSELTGHFWVTSYQLLQLEVENAPPNSLDRARLTASMRMHKLMRQGVMEGGLRYALLSLVKR